MTMAHQEQQQPTAPPVAPASGDGVAAEDNEHGKNTNNKRPYKRFQKGRSSRRRKAKLRAIHEAEAQLSLQQVDEHTTTTTDVPTLDRSRIWPSVFQFRSLSKQDEAGLIGQLGFLPGNAICVAARWSDHIGSDITAQKSDAPIVLRLYPICIRDAYAGGKVDGRKFKFKSRKRGNKNNKQAETSEQPKTSGEAKAAGDTTAAASIDTMEPFPTLYWLTHPYLRTLVSKLELGDTHNSKMLEQRLLADPDGALLRMTNAHQQYGHERWNDWLTEEDRLLLEQKKWQHSVNTERGVAGIRKPQAIKCLHAHVAHYLSGCQDNIVGKWVWDEVVRMMRERHAKEVGVESQTEEEEEAEAMIAPAEEKTAETKPTLEG